MRVLEVASWTFVPAAGAVLADWGADVLKIEHPEMGDPQRGLMTMGIMPGGSAGVDFMMEFPNRGKRSVAIDIASDDGRELLYRLAEKSDVFLTNFLPHTRQKLLIDVEHIRARNPRIVYVRGHGQGHRGPESHRGGYDGASYWSRGGVGDTLTPPGSEWPLGLRPAFGDVMGGLTIAGGISAALFAREKTGEAPVVDVSLLHAAMWQIQPDIVISKVLGMDDVMRFGDRKGSHNPLVGTYRTADDRYIFLNMMQSDRYFPDLVRRMGHAELLDDERFNSAAGRAKNNVAFIDTFDKLFGSKTLAEWKVLLKDTDGVWAPIQRAPELYDDPQVEANGYLRSVTDTNGNEFQLVSAPVQFDETPPELRSAPLHGQHTDDVMRELLGMDDETLINHKISGALL
jgi:crotonobetainyl-CoA:carnitine CoA-transferase CaiB-like acyl-CoA transferase